MKPRKSSDAATVRLAARSKLERQALILSERCPVDGTNPPGCPLSGLRPLGLAARTKWVKNLTLADLEYLMNYERGCAAERRRQIELRRARLARNGVASSGAGTGVAGGRAAKKSGAPRNAGLSGLTNAP